MNRIRLSFFCLLLLFSCTRQQEDPIVAQIKIRSMQTRTFVGHNANTVMKEVIAVLQDEGYIVKNVSNDLGILTAERSINIEKFSSKFWAYVFSRNNARWKKHSLIELNSNVTEEQGRAKLRVNFLIRIYDNLGRIVDVHQILEETAYLDFFNKVQKGLMDRPSVTKTKKADP